MLLGAWWLYLLTQMVDGHDSKVRPNIEKLVLWEGGTFVVLLILVSWAFFALYMKDRKKTKALSAFFAGMTHELKTPLASVRLQAEVIDDIVKENKNERLKNVVNRLLLDTQKLENQMDKILQLSRFESGGNLNTTESHLLEQIELTFKRWGKQLKFHFEGPPLKNDLVLIDEFAFELVMRNLIENTIIHANSNNVIITFKDYEDKIDLIYSDHGQFSGDPQKLGKLFYKHNSKRGSGIGLYLIQGLMQKMGGELSIDISTHISFRLSLEKASTL
ncbi:MAG: HAMP domain-containing sensor histidine kinase [Bdellovibrio sp.]